MQTREDYDVVIVGARCAGAATALVLAREGLRVLLLEKGSYGSDTLSTHALMRAGVQQLHNWDLIGKIEAAGTPCVTATTFHYAGDVIPIALQPKNGVKGLYAPRRYLLDRVLVDAAVEAGAKVLYQHRVTHLQYAANGRVSGVVAKEPGGPSVEISARWVVGADGMRSTVAQLVEAQTYEEGQFTTSVIFSYWSGLQGVSAGYHWYYQLGCAAGIIPSNEGACVFVNVPPKRFQSAKHELPDEYLKVLSECDPLLRESLVGAERVAPFKGFPGQPGFVKQSHGSGWALVGDAGYFKDPITAHGITDSLIDASALAEALLEDTDEALARYQSKRDERARGLFAATDAIASLEWSLDELRALHLGISKAMKLETDALCAEPSAPKSSHRQAVDARDSGSLPT